FMFFFSSRRRHTRFSRDWSSDVCSSDLNVAGICALVSTEKHADALGLVAGLKPEGSRRLARVCFPQTNIVEAERTIVQSIAQSQIGRASCRASAPSSQGATQLHKHHHQD